MGVLADLTVQLQTKLRSVGAECQPADLEQAMADAVTAYSERRPRLSPLTINLVAGQSEYSLPEDWIMMEPVTWAALTRPQAEPINVYDNQGYGRPRTLPGALLPSSARSTYEVYEGYPATLVVSPTPSASGTLPLKIYSQHVVSNTDGATTVPKRDWPLIVLRAVWEVWESIVRERAARPVSFDVGGEGQSRRIRMADPDALQKLADSSLKAWNDRMDRPAGVMG